MRKNISTAHARRWRVAGIATAVAGAAVFVAPQAAWAAATVVPSLAPVGAPVVVTESSPTFTAGVSRVQLTTAATCNAKFTTASASIITAALDGASSTTAITVTIPAGATGGSNGQAKKYMICVYSSADLVTSALQGTYGLLVGTAATPVPASGITGGGTSITITSGGSTAIFTGVTAPSAIFTAASDCGATYGTPIANMTAAVTKSSDIEARLTVPAGVVATTADLTKYNICLYNGSTSAATLISSVPFGATQAVLNTTVGPWGGGNGLNVTSPTPFLAGVDAPGVVFKNGSTCAAKYSATNTLGTTVPVAASDVRKLTDSRLAVTVPALTATAPATTAAATFQACIYNGAVDTSSDLLATIPYAVKTVQTATGVSPKAGPALGGSKITITGTAFPTETGKITATLGGAPLTDITPINAGAFTAVTPQHAPANNVALVVTTAAGSYTLGSAYSYTSALKVAPNTAPNTRAIDIIVNGIGFESASWSNSNNQALPGSHLYLVKGQYAGGDIGSTVRANPPTAECMNVLVLADTELICNLNLTRRLNLVGTGYLIAAPVALAVDTAVGSKVIKSTADFTPDMVGMLLTETGTDGSVPAGATVTDVISVNAAVISAPAIATDTAVAVNATGSLFRTATIGIVASDAAISGTDLATADVGKYAVPTATVPVTGYPALGTTIATRTSATAGTLSAATSGATPANIPVNLYNPTLPVPEGAYQLTYVSSGSVGAAELVQSSVSSTSTFTVASF